MGRKQLKKYKIYCPTYKRRNTAITHKLFDDNFCYVVRENESESYRDISPHPLMIIPDKSVSNISETRNWILKNKQSDYVVMVDDDISSFNFMFNRRLNKLDKQSIVHMIDNGFQMAQDCGAGLWGMNVNSDPIAYRTYMPFCFSKVILGPFSGILDTEIKYDERIPLKEDYDLFLQHLNNHRKVLRFNFLSYSCDHQKLAGGCQETRTSEREKEQFEIFRQKWGSIVKHNTRIKSINPIVRPGL